MHSSFCKHVNEYPVYKVDTGSELLVYVGSNEDFWNTWNSKKQLALKKKSLVEAFGKGAINKFSLNNVKAKYIDRTLYHDDTIRTVMSKVGGALTCKTMCTSDEFLNNVFQGKTMISSSILTDSFKSATGDVLNPTHHKMKDMVSLKEAKQLCKGITWIYKPLEYKFDDGSYIAIPGAERISLLDETLESFNSIGNTLFLRNEMQIKTYSSTWLKHNDEMLDSIIKYKPTSEIIKCFPNFIHYRINRLEKGILLNMFKLFNDVVPNEKAPFMKWISTTKTLFKVHTSFSHNRSVLGSWTKFENTRYIKANNEIIVLKVPLEGIDLIGTVVIFSNGMYDIKINFKVGNRLNSKQIENHVGQIGSILVDMFPGFPLVDVEEPAFKIMVSGIIEDNRKTVNDVQLQKSIEDNLGPVFTVIGNSDGLSLIYKRGRHFQNEENAMKFMSQHYSLGKQELVAKVAHIFGLEESNANDVYKQWKSDNKLAEGKGFVKFKTLKQINVKVKCSKLNYKFIVDGATTATEVRRIVQALKYAVFMGRNVVGAKAKKMKQIDIDNEGEFDEFDIDMSDLGLDIDAFKEDEFLNKEEDDEDVDVDVDVENDASVMELKRRMVCPKAATGGDKDAWMHKYVLNKLYDADKDLFYFQKGDKKYAKTCQKVSMRQPIVTSKMELDYNEKCFPKAITGSVNYGTTEEHAQKNHYWCPKVWCPKSRVGLTMDQFKNEYKGKCPFPSVDETPIIFEHKDYWKGKERQIGYLSPTEHPNQFCMPCCFVKKLSEKNNKCVQTVGNDKYIKTESFPVEEKRYGLLPEVLSSFFDNKFCGGKDGGQGLMNENTDCFLRIGIPLNNQSFIQSMIMSLDNDKLNTVDDFVNAVVKNVDMELFLSCHDGLLCKRFLEARTRKPNIDDLRDFNEFKVWFLSTTNSDYVERFNLGVLATTLKHLLTFEPKVKYSKYIIREFRLFNAYMAFKEYMMDFNIRKTHDILSHIVQIQRPWMNSNGYNLIVIEEGKDEGSFSISCPIFSDAKAKFNKERPIVILLKQGAYYEPIHYVKHNSTTEGKKGIVGITKKHMISDNASVAKIAALYLDTCVGQGFSEAEKIKASLGKKVVSQLLNFDLHVVALYLSNHMVVPFKNPIPMDVAHKSSFMFLDTFLKSFNHDIDVQDVKKELENINSFIANDYYVVEGVLKTKTRNVALKVKECYVFVPLTKYDNVKKSAVYKDVIRDGAIFIGHEKSDLRKDFIEKTNYIDSLFIFLWNEIVMLMNRDDIKQLVLAHRHPSNPIPKSYKRAELKQELSKLLPRVLYKGRDRESVLNTRICSTISKKGECYGQCMYIANLNDKGQRIGAHCKLSVPGTYYDILLEKCIEDLLNSLIPLTVRSNMEKKTNKVITFSDQDIKKEGGLDKILMRGNLFGSFDFQHEGIPIPNNFHNIIVEDNNGSDSRYVSGEKIPLPTFLVPVLKEFSLHTLGRKETWLVDLFHLIQNKVTPDATMSRDQVEHFWKEGGEDTWSKLDALCAAIKVNCIMVSRKSLQNPDRVRCMGKQSDVDFYVMLNMSMEGKKEIFHLFVKNKKKFLFTRSDFPDNFGTIIKNKCIVRMLNA